MVINQSEFTVHCKIPLPKDTFSPTGGHVSIAAREHSRTCVLLKMSINTVETGQPGVQQKRKFLSSKLGGLVRKCLQIGQSR